MHVNTQNCWQAISPIAIDVTVSCSVCHSVTFVHCAQTAEDVDTISFRTTAPFLSRVDRVKIWLTSVNPFLPKFEWDIRWKIAAEWLKIAQWSQWRAYRKPPSLFRMVLSLTPYDLPFPQMGSQMHCSQLTSRRVLPSGEYDRRAMSPFAKLLISLLNITYQRTLVPSGYAPCLLCYWGSVARYEISSVSYWLVLNVCLLCDDDVCSTAAQIGRQLAYIGDTINERHSDQFGQMIRLLNLTPETAYEAFAGIARKYAARSLSLSFCLSFCVSMYVSVFRPIAVRPQHLLSACMLLMSPVLSLIGLVTLQMRL